MTRESEHKRRVSVLVPEDLHRRARVKAVQEGISITAIVVRALAEYVGEKRPRGKEANAETSTSG